MAASPAYLYDATLEPVGHVGVLMKMFGQTVDGSYPATYDAAVFSWPNGVDEGSAFAVRTESAGGATRWRSPHEVIHLRAVGRPARTNVAFVVLEGPARATDTVHGARGDHTTGIEKHGIRAELVSFSALFQPLVDETVARIELDSLRKVLGDPRSPRRALATPGYTRSTGPPKVINRSICRLLHWD